MYFPEIAILVKNPEFVIDFKYLNLFEKSFQLHVNHSIVGNAKPG